jgi:hypothetical protein
MAVWRAGGQHLAEDHFIDLGRIEPVLLQQLADHGRAQVHRGHVGQGALEAANGGTGGGDDNDFLHDAIPHGGYERSVTDPDGAYGRTMNPC